MDDNCWTETIMMNRSPNFFKLDTDTTVTGVSKKCTKSHNLFKAKKLLKGSGNTTLIMIGMLFAKLSHKDQETVIKGQSSSFLVKQCVNLVGMGVKTLLNSLVLFKKQLGKLDSNYIPLKPDVKTVCIYTPCKIARHLLSKVKA